jgi:hypothetical protein
MSTYAKLICTVKTVTSRGDIFLRSPHGDVYLSPAIAKTAKETLAVGCEVTCDVATGWNQKKHKPGLVALNLTDVTMPVIVSADGFVKWHDSAKNHGYVKIIAGEYAGRDAVLNKDTKTDVVPGKGMPVTVTFMVVGNKLIAQAFSLNVEIAKQVKELQVAAEAKVSSQAPELRIVSTSPEEGEDEDDTDATAAAG